MEKSKLQKFEPVFCEGTIPLTLEQGKLYISRKYHTAIHLCACGCGNRTVTPLGPNEWSLRESEGKVTLRPSIGNFEFPCKSHYYITDNTIE